MSLILDALRKSERERLGGDAASTRRSVSMDDLEADASAARSTGRRWPVVVGLLVALSILGGAAGYRHWMGRGSAPVAKAPSPDITAEAEKLAAEATETPPESDAEPAETLALSSDDEASTERVVVMSAAAPDGDDAPPMQDAAADTAVSAEPPPVPPAEPILADEPAAGAAENAAAAPESANASEPVSSTDPTPAESEQVAEAAAAPPPEDSKQAEPETASKGEPENVHGPEPTAEPESEPSSEIASVGDGADGNDNDAEPLGENVPAEPASGQDASNNDIPDDGLTDDGPADDGPADDEVGAEDPAVDVAETAPDRFPIPSTKPEPPARSADRSDEPRSLGAAEYYERAVAFEAEGLHQRAIAAYTDAILEKPDFVEAYYGRAWAHVANGGYAEAIDNFTRLLAIQPALPEAYFGRGWAHERAGQSREAIRDYGEAIRIAPDRPGLRFNRGILKLYEGDFSGAERDFSAVRRSGNAKERDLATLWTYVARGKAGAPTADILPALRDVPARSSWPGIIVDFYFDRISADEVIEATLTGDFREEAKRGCTAFYFLGQHALLSGNEGDAANYFRRAVSTEATSLRQYWAALLELDRLGIVL